MLEGFSADELQRYSRHLRIPEVGLAGQARLRGGSVLLIGCGGLGSPAALYLAAAGVGRIGIVDPDVVELSNLQRQVVHGESWVGRPKLESAAERLREVNPWVVVEGHRERFTAANALRIAGGYDVLVDGSDNFPTRFLTNDTAFFLQKPLVYGAIQRFDGQLAVFAPHLGGPCYRCMLPVMPPAGAVPSCSEAGVLGVLPGIIGSLQAMEAIKLLLGIGVVPLGQLVVYDALRTRFRSVRIAPDPGCRLCGVAREIAGVENAETLASTSCGSDFPTMKSIETSELRRLLDGPFEGLLIDVREPDEHAVASIPGARLIPLATLPEEVASLPRDCDIYVHCKMGGRSARAVKFLEEQGFTRVFNVAGGIESWLAEG